MVIGPGAASSFNLSIIGGTGIIYPWQDLAVNTGGIYDAATNGDYSGAVINALATLC